MFILNPRFLLCFGIAWIITNGWSYVMLGVGTYFGIPWMIAVSGAYLAFLWLPISPEKIVTFGIAIVLLRFLFPKDEKTLAIMKKGLQKVKDAFKRKDKKKSSIANQRQESVSSDNENVSDSDESVSNANKSVSISDKNAPNNALKK